MWPLKTQLIIQNFRFVSWWPIRKQNIREINNATKNDENFILHEEPFLNSHEMIRP